MKDMIRDVIGGTPAEIGAKILIAALAALWGNLQVVGMSVFLYFVLLVIDAVMGALVSMKEGQKFSVKHFTFGPLKKFALTAAMLFVASIVDTMIPDVSWIPDTPLFIAVASFVGLTALLDVARKYGILTGSELIKWLEKKIGKHVDPNE
jgi:hypothetical protein